MTITMRTVYSHIKNKGGTITSPGKVHIREKLAGARGMNLSGSAEIKALNAALVLLARAEFITFNKASVTITGEMGADTKYDEPITHDASGDKIFFGPPPVVTLTGGGDLKLSAPLPALPATEATRKLPAVALAEDRPASGPQRRPVLPIGTGPPVGDQSDAVQAELVALRQQLDRRTMAGPSTSQTRPIRDRHWRQPGRGDIRRGGAPISDGIDVSDTVFRLEDANRLLGASNRTNTDLRHQLAAQEEAHQTELAQRDEVAAKLRTQVEALKGENFALETTITVLTGERDEALAQSLQDGFEAGRAREHEETILHELEALQADLEKRTNDRATILAVELTAALRGEIDRLKGLGDEQAGRLAELEHKLVKAGNKLADEEEMTAEILEELRAARSELEFYHNDFQAQEMKEARELINSRAGARIFSEVTLSCGCEMFILADAIHGVKAGCRIVTLTEKSLDDAKMPVEILLQAPDPRTRAERRGQPPKRRKRH